MEFIHINKDNLGDIEKLKGYLKDGKDVFVLIYMIGCGPCNATKPEWAKLEETDVLGDLKQKDGIIIVDIDKDYVDKLEGSINIDSINGFPTIRHIKNGTEEDFENSSVTEKTRTADAFKKWIEMKTGMKGGLRKRRTRRMKAGKWSRKYKRSINCRRPKGFSQRQYCKYGRKSRNKHRK